MTIDEKFKIGIGWGMIAVIVLMPFHAFLSVYFGSLTGHQTLIQTWKDLVIVVIGLLAAALVVISKPDRERLIKPVNLAIVAFILVGLIVSIIHPIMIGSFVLGAKTDLEFLILFILAQLIPAKQLERNLIWAIALPAIIVVAIGLLQVYALKPDFLTHFGYGPKTLLPYALVDPAVPNSIRIISTLPGPNQLGEYLILPICLFLVLLVKRRNWWAGVALIATLIIEFHTYSRSAWIGAIVALVGTAVLLLPRRLAWAVGGLCLVATLSFGLFARGAILKQSKLQYYLLHGRFFSQEVQGSTASHFDAFKSGVGDALAHPLGEGLGTAGPASEQTKRPVITENYYLQLAIETGLVGLALFLSIIGLLAWRLWEARVHSDLAVGLIGALIGLSAVNLFLHGWADSSTALVFWGSAGGLVALTTEAKAHG